MAYCRKPLMAYCRKPLSYNVPKAHIRLMIEIEFRLKFNHLIGRKRINFKFSEFCFDWSNSNLISISNLIQA